MRILAMRPEPRGSGESSIVARFDAETYYRCFSYWL